MKQRKLPTGPKIYLPLVLALVIFVFMLPQNPRFSYEYKKGEHWKYENLIAEFDFPLLKTEGELDAEKDSVTHVKIPFFNKKEEVLTSAVATVENLFAASDDSVSCQLITNALKTVYAKGVFDALDADHYNNLPVDAKCAIVQNYYDDEYFPIGEIHTLESARQYFKEQLQNLDTTLPDTTYVALNPNVLVVPDLKFSSTLTDEKYSEKKFHLSYTNGYIGAGHEIVKKGQMITDDIANLLDSYKAEFDKSVAHEYPRALWIGLGVIALMMVVIFFFTLYFCDYKIFVQYNKYLYVLLLYVAFSVVTFFFYTRGEIDYYYMIPYSLMAMLMMAFFRKGFVMIMYFITLLPLLIVTSGTVSVFFIHLIAGFMGIYIYQTLNKGWLQFVGTFIIYVIMAAVWFGFCMIFDNVGNWYLLLYIALAAVLSIAGYPLIYLFEKLFRLVSSDKLVELSDTSNTLLRLLADKAPGTFHHSLQVMNLADAAARAIDADVPLVRAAALYHDIGKINNPQCFTENEAPGVKVHDGLTPKESAQLIIKHVSDGLALAEKHNLPQVLKDFIVTHHGTTCASYFLTKYLNEGGDPEDVADFYYGGVKPVTREQVILMLSDAVEAASRSLKDYSGNNISNLVDKIAEGKANEGQFDEADITLKELNTIKDVMKSFLQQVYHSRIEYPKRIRNSKK